MGAGYAIYPGIQAALRLIYPPRCVGCGNIVESDFGLCGTCWRDTPFVSGPVCEGCGVPLPGPVDGHRVDCDACMQSPRSWQKGRTVMLYAEMGRKLVLALKHGDRQDIARPAGRWLAQAARPLLEPDMIVAPVPLHRLRLLKRRYNQSALLARRLAEQVDAGHGPATDLTLCPDLLVRSRQTASLDGKSREQRFETVQGAISVHPRHRPMLQGRPVLLVDDVMTSGATLDACTAACIGAGSGDVHVLVLARVAKDA